jgi:hypothetical protein
MDLRKIILLFSFSIIACYCGMDKELKSEEWINQIISESGNVLNNPKSITGFYCDKPEPDTIYDYGKALVLNEYCYIKIN